MLTWTGADPMNGMTRAGYASDTARGIVFGWEAPALLEFDIAPAHRNLAPEGFLSFRACQVSRHPDTIAVLEDLSFGVTLIDELGASSTIDISAYGGGIEEPYQRTGSGTGVGVGADVAVGEGEGSAEGDRSGDGLWARTRAAGAAPRSILGPAVRRQCSPDTGRHRKVPRRSRS